MRELNCSFCGKTQREVKKLIAGPSVYICDECITLCNEIVDEETVKIETTAQLTKLPKPKEINHTLDEYVIHQDRAKKILSVALYNHYKRIYAPKTSRPEDVELQKSNILLIGPTGTGKTLLAQTLARILQVPFSVADATSLTEAGYVGEDVENILLNLVQAANGDIEKAQNGIIYIDEIDKISRKSDSASITRDVSGEGVQQALLKIMEGTVANIPPKGGRKHPQQEYLKLDTSNILFICGGAFAGLDKIIETRVTDKSMGISAKLSSVNSDATSGNYFAKTQVEDLVKYGMIPEFLGRIPVIATLDTLKEDALIKILTEPKNAIVKQYIRLFDMEDVELEISKDALEAVATEAIKRKTGARGLRSILENSLLDIMYEIPNHKDCSKCIVDRDVITKNKKPELIFTKPASLLESEKKGKETA